MFVFFLVFGQLNLRVAARADRLCCRCRVGRVDWRPKPKHRRSRSPPPHAPRRQRYRRYFLCKQSALVFLVRIFSTCYAAHLKRPSTSRGTSASSAAASAPTSRRSPQIMTMPRSAQKTLNVPPATSRNCRRLRRRLKQRNQPADLPTAIRVTPRPCKAATFVGVARAFRSPCASWPKRLSPPPADVSR